MVVNPLKPRYGNGVLTIDDQTMLFGGYVYYDPIQTEVWKFFDECDVMSLEKCQSYAMEHTVYSNRYKFGVAMYQVPWNYCRL